MTRRVYLVPLALAASLTPSVFAQQFPLGQPTQLTFSTTRPQKMVPGDFTGNGQVDVLMSSTLSPGLRLLEGNGQGSFAVPFLGGNIDGQIPDFATGDLDGDGDLDAVALVSAGDAASTDLVRLTNDGSGNFSTEVLLSGTDVYVDVDVADLTGDGILDLVLARQNGPDVDVVYLPAQAGAYGSPSAVIATSANFNPWYGLAFVVTDVDSDGILDLAIGEFQGPLLFAKGLGGGAFAGTASVQATGGETLRFPAKLEDISGDGITDYLELTANRARYFEGLGGGSFAAAVPFGPTLGALNHESATRTLDADGDGDLDVAVVELFGPPPFFEFGSVIYLQTSPGTFGAGILTGADLLPDSVQADINGDGRVDLILPGASQGSLITRQLNDQPAAAGFFSPSEGIGSLASTRASGSLVGDPDGDGDLDILYSSAGEPTIGWLENLAPGVMAPPAVLATLPSIERLYSVTDVDGDMDMDLVTREVSGLTFWLNDGSQSYTAAPGPPTPAGLATQRLFLEDMDGDGDADLLALEVVGQPGALQAQLYSNDGNGAFTPSIVVSDSVGMFDLRVGEFTGDSVPDLVLLRNVGSLRRLQVQVHPGLGAGSFGAPIADTELAASWRLEAKDVDLDGLTDILVHDTGEGIVLRRALGGGIFDQPVTLVPAPARTPQAVVQAIDFDGDGDVDILFRETYLAFAGGLVLLAEQTTPGTFRDGFPVEIGRPDAPLGGLGLPLQLIDLDGDGDGEAIGTFGQEIIARENFGVVNVGSAFCFDATYQDAPLTAVGSEVLGQGQLTLVAPRLPTYVFGMAVGSRTTGAPMPVAGNESSLCLNGPIGRYDGPGQIMNSGSNGLMTLELDLGALELPGGSVPAQVGETWSFQIWHRAPPGAGQTSRFTNGVTVQLR